MIKGQACTKAGYIVHSLETSRNSRGDERLMLEVDKSLQNCRQLDKEKAEGPTRLTQMKWVPLNKIFLFFF
jgi:hypothetical protein